METIQAMLQQANTVIQQLARWLSRPESWIILLLSAVLTVILSAFIRSKFRNAVNRRCRRKKTLHEIQRRARFRVDRVEMIDDMEGHDFEEFCAELLRRNGFEDVEVTQGSGDQGVDILAQKDDIRYAIQCKNYNAKLGNTPVQEIYAGKTYYHCHVGAVMTNSMFTQSAADLADATNVLLWDREKLQRFMDNE